MAVESFEQEKIIYDQGFKNGQLDALNDLVELMEENSSVGGDYMDALRDVKEFLSTKIKK